jgi:flagellum-specific ATP synthase
MRATAIAEAFRADGKKVLLLIDSLTRVAHAQREIGLTLGEPPTMKGYPPSVFALIPALVERAGNDNATGGSIARSLSRTMVDSVDSDHAAAAARFRQLWSAYEENRDLMLMGAYVAGADSVLDEAIALRAHQLAFVSQPAAAQVDFEHSRQALIEGYSA